MLQAADVIALERFTGRMDLVGYYGLGIMFSSASIFVLHTVERYYFKSIADAFAQKQRFWHATARFFLAGTCICLGLMLGVNLFGPWLLRLIFGSEYEPSIAVLRISSLGILLYGFWAMLSMIYVVIKMSRYSVVVSVAGLLVGVASLFRLIPSHGVVGAAWAMNLAYAAGSAVGFILLFRFRRQCLAAGR